MLPGLAEINGMRGPEPPLAPNDSIKKSDLPYPLKDRQGDFITDDQQNSFLLDDPKQIEKKVEYDPETDQYILTETLDGRNVKPPTYLTFEEYREYERERAQREYWEERAKSISLVEQKGVVPPLYVTKKRFGDIFGGNTIDIKPAGNIDLTFGGNVQKIDNPILTENQRKNGGFDFDMNINLSVVGKIGDKVKINMNYNTGATFDFENQIKLNYEGEEDDIIKLIEAGNVTFPLPTTLITGSQSLFGLKTKLQFGRLTITSVYSQQKSKLETVTIDKGAQTSEFEVFTDQYDENRHFFLGQYFREGDTTKEGTGGYNKALSNLPNLNTQVEITRIEVWITNRTGATENARDIVGFMDLGESQLIYNKTSIQPTPGRQIFPDNSANNLYASVLGKEPGVRKIDQVERDLLSLGLQAGQDYEKTYARKLNPTEYSFNSQLGFLSLNQALYNDEVVAVAYEYKLNGNVFRVGEFAEAVTQDLDTAQGSVATSQILFLKLLKGTSARPKLPIWNLMMKNIYPLGAFQVNQEDFKLNILYQDPGGGEKRYIPEGNLNGIPLIRVLSLDRLNSRMDPQPDGVFDFVPGTTITPQNGRVIFPVLEPFGDDLRAEFVKAGDAALANKYVYDQLYDSTKVIAQQFPQFNRFVLEGTYKSDVSNVISLGAFNVPPGSVKVMAGGQQLVEGQDFTVDNSLGRVTIINEGVLNSGVPINVSYENNALFGFQTKTMFGTRLDYKVNDKFSWGGTLLHLRERPFTEKVNIGEDPIKNMQLGLDANYNTESQFLTWLVDKLPLYETKEASSFSLSGEMAHLKPGHQRAIGKDGTVYIDDFEGTTSSYQMNYPVTSWVLSSTPKNALGKGGNLLFPEAALSDSLVYGFNRARLTWYNIDPLFTRNNSATPSHIEDNKKEQLNAYTREIQETEVFPNRSQPYDFETNLLTFDLSYYPKQKGPYNFDTRAVPGISAGVLPDGSLDKPESRWGGIMRSIDNTDFESSNTEYIEFWLLDPFIYNKTIEGELYINLGNISEDILKDGRKFYENGLQEPGSTSSIDTTNWGVVPRNQPITTSFDNDVDKRQYQDLGLDGLNDEAEINYFNSYLSGLNSIVTDQAIFNELSKDPSNDNYHYYRGDDYDQKEVSIRARYKKYNNSQGNSPVSSSGQTVSEAATNIPDSEDLNRDFTLNETEEYFQYRVELKPGMDVGDGYITDKVVVTIPEIVRDPNEPDGDIGTMDITYYQFKIPIDEYERKVGNISDFKSIRFIRMFLTGFEDSVTVRFAKLELVRNQWRRYRFALLDPGEYVPDDESGKTVFSVSSVNVEENSEKLPIPYALPPGIEREQNISSPSYSDYQNEQALQVNVCDLADGDSRAVYKTLNLDLRTYSNLKMYIHGESGDLSDPLQNGDVRVFIRLGSDFTNNYYEYEVPLSITHPGTYSSPPSDADRDTIWPASNRIDIPLDSFYRVKLVRDVSNPDPTSPFVLIDKKGNRFTVVGNPDIGMVKTAMLGIRNPKSTGDNDDDGRPKCVEVWFNEFRLSGLDEKGGWAATARMEAKLADLGAVTFSTLMHTRGYGQIEQKVQERFKDDLWQYDLAANVELGKFLPEKAGLRIPMYGGISQSFSTPEYDPYQLDVPLADKLNFAPDRKDYKRQVQDRTTIKSLNFTNVRYVPSRSDKKVRFYDPSNLNFTFAYTKTTRSTAFIESDLIKKYRASMGYNFSPQAKPLAPFSKVIKNKNKYLDIIRDININFIPSSLSFSTEFNRQFGETRLRQLESDEIPAPPTYDKYFTWDRVYGLKYNPFKSLTIDFNAINNASIDEPQGRINDDEIRPGFTKKDSLWRNIFHWGRTTRYQHNLSANYSLPLSKIPAIDWLQARAGYTTNYTWVTGPLTAMTDEYGNVIRDAEGNVTVIKNPLGNTIGNTSDIKLNGEIDLKKLYDKSKLLRPFNSTKARADNEWKKKDRDKKIAENEKRRRKIEDDIEKLQKEIEDIKEKIKEVKKDTIPNKKEEVKKLKKERKDKKKKIKKLKSDKNKIQDPESPIVSPLVRPIIALKRVSVNYNISRGTTVPGYLPGTKILGLSGEGNSDYQNPGYNKFGFGRPGWDFVFGYQPDMYWMRDAAANGWITPDTNLNYQLQQFITKTLDVRATLEPFRDFKVDLTMNKSTSEHYSAYFKKQDSNSGFRALTPTTTGSFSVSFIAIKTMFKKADNDGFTESFRKLQDEYREVVSARLAEGNPNSDGVFLLPASENDTSDVPYDRYREGYGPYSKEVLIPAFLAAYRGKDINTATLDPFDVFPLPNWRVTYNGLSKLPGFKKVMSSINITHGYNSTYTVSGYITDLFYEGNGYFQPSKIDTLSNNFVSLYSIPTVNITEQFAPLIGIDITWNKNVTTRFDFKKTRSVSLGLVDYQVSESKTTEVTVGLGYRLKGLVLPFKFRGKKKKLPNEINFRFDFSYRDNVTFNQRLDQDVSEPTRGSKTIRTNPKIDYEINKRLTFTLFFERTRTIPATSASFPITNTKAGITLRFSLTQ